MADYKSTYAEWQNDPTGFWAEAAKGVDWIQPPNLILDDTNAPLTTWFADGVANTCYNAVDRHVEAGRGAQTAILHDSPVTNSKTEITYDTLLDRVSRVAGVLTTRGVAKGDRVIIYMPMVPDALIAMLACARIGAIHSVVFGGFAAHELAVRIDDATPKAILAASCGIEGKKVIAYKPLLDGAIARADHKPDFTLILQRPQVAADLVSGYASNGRRKKSLRLRLGAHPLAAQIGSIFSIHPARRASRKASCAKPAGIWLRSIGQ